jgi:hypothetical protein
MNDSNRTATLLAGIDTAFSAARGIVHDGELRPEWRAEFIKLADELSTLYLGTRQLIELAE